MMRTQSTALQTAAIERRLLFGAAIGTLLLPIAARADTKSSAAARMNELGTESQGLVQRVGLWDMTETVWDTPDAAPVTTTGLVAERRIIGSMLEEIVRPMSDVSPAAIKRIDYLGYNRVEGRWDYVSMDTRAAVGIMPASSLTRGEDAKIVLTFQPFAVPGAGQDVTGQMLRMEQVIMFQGADRDVKEQHFIMADGTGTMWLAHRYAYVRRS